MSSTPAQRYRCPCCGEIFALADAEPVVETVAAAPTPTAPAPAADLVPTSGTMLDVQIVFDGGSRGNPGQGYGSYQLTVRGKAETPQRLRFGDDYTNNEAEYDTLIEALEAVVRRAKDSRRVRLEIKGDSQLVINQINGTWKAKDQRMQERREHALELLGRMGAWRATWHARGKSVKALGH